MLNATFRRILIASGLLIGASLVLSPSAMADSANGNTSGTVDPINNVDYTPPAGATLNPSAGNADMGFGSLFIQNNDNDGWTLTVDSTNNGTLVDAVSSAVIPYSNLDFVDATSGTPLGNQSAVDVSGAAIQVYGPTSLTCADSTGCTVNLRADVSAGDIDGKPAGTYSDTLTFVLTNR